MHNELNSPSASDSTPIQQSSRRRFLGGAAAGLLVPPLTGVATATANANADPDHSTVPSNFTIKNGRVRQSIMGWTYKDRMDMLELARLCKQIGMEAIEGIPEHLYPQVRDLGLKISLVSGGHGFSKGPCDPKHRQFVVDKLSQAIELAAEIGTQNVITFTGMRYDGMDDAEAAQGCVDAWKQVIPLAEFKGVTLVLEHLNSRDNTHPMKGHPGYFGDDVDFCVELIRRVDSPNMKLLFDIYHVSIMNGDIIRRIGQYKDVIAHYHTAGNPGRGELDDTQEINYPAILRAILATGYDGYVTHEFIPTWKDHELSLRHAAMLCDL